MSKGSEEAYDFRTILSQMQQEYWQGLSEEQTETQELLECLIFLLGGERHAFETRYACEVIRIPKLVKVPAVQSLITGIFNLRGEITAAMDIRPMLGLPQPETGSAGRIVVVRSDSFATGIITESTLGVKGLSFESFEPAPATNRRDFVRGHFHDEEGPVILLDIEELLASPGIMVGEA